MPGSACPSLCHALHMQHVVCNTPYRESLPAPLRICCAYRKYYSACVLLAALPAVLVAYLARCACLLVCFAPCSAVFWLAAFSGASAMALLPDIAHMLFSRYFRPSLATVLQVSVTEPLGLLLIH